jgi:hypothetical protein
MMCGSSQEKARLDKRGGRHCVIALSGMGIIIHAEVLIAQKVSE